MSKFLYPIKNLEIMPWIKYWLLNKGKTPSGVLSEIITGTSPLTLSNSVRKKFNIFNIGGNTLQDGTPTPEAPIPIENVSGEVEVKVANGTDSTAQGYEEQTATLHLPEGMEMVSRLTIVERFIKQDDKWYKEVRFKKVRILPTDNMNILGNYMHAYIQLKSDRFSNKLNNASVWCSHLQNIELSMSTDNSKKIGIANVNTDMEFRFRDRTGTLDLDKTKQWLTDNEVILYYVLKTPVLEEITDPTLISDLENLKNLYSYKGTTYISSSNAPSPVFEVQYYMEGE